MREMLRAALQLAEADYCEIRLEESNYLNITFRGRGLEQILKEIKYGGNVRALYKGAWGFAAFNKLDKLPDMIKAACRQAKLASEYQSGESKLAAVPVVEEEFMPEYTLNPGAITLEEKVRILTRYKELILNFHPAITAASIVYKETHSDLYFVNTDGTFIKQRKLDIGAYLSAIACKGDVTVTQGIGRGSSSGFDCMLNCDNKLREACALAVRLLDAPQVKAGVYTVVCDQELAGLFVHEAFGHLSEADGIYRKPAALENLALGRKLGKDFLHIYDSGEYFGHRGAMRYDDEGVAAERTYLIKNGILVGRLHSRETAGIMNEQPTGSARATNYTFPPICRMRNTCISPGTSSFDDMLKEVKLGVYAVGSGGGETNGEMFTFNAGYGYMIRDGRLAELVKDVKLMGNVFTTLENIDMIGDEAEGRDSAGGCGKNEQIWLPVSGVCPSIRIQNVIVGGAK